MKISWRILRGLEKTFGPSFYLFDATAFDRNFAEFLAAFRGHYPRTALAYSYKTNYLPRLCRRVNALGGYAEVVSGMEYALARRVGVLPDRIIFNGPYKTAGDIERALTDGALVNLDSPAEVDLVRGIARKRPRSVLRIALRCNFDLGASGVSRFGIDAAGHDLAAAIARLGRIRNCRIDGLHCHWLPPGRSAAAYAAIARRMLDLARQCFGARPPGLLDLGGGFCSRMPPGLAAQFDFPIPTFQEYARAIAAPLAAAFPGNGPELILEPGLALAADTLSFAAKVVALKTIRSKTYALLSASVYDVQPTKNQKTLPLRHFPQPGGARARRRSGPMDLVGYTCMEDDCLCRNYPGALAAGDYVVFQNVGAYTIVLKPPFIAPAPAILGWDAARRQFEVLRRGEKFDDVFATYVFDPPGIRLGRGTKGQRIRGILNTEQH